jgi:Tfp pilus assembly protein PilF
MTLPQTAVEFFRRAMSRHRQGDLAGALADFEEAARLDPASAELHNNCGALRRAMGDLDGALAAFEEALRCNPRSAEAHNNRGVVRLTRGDLTGALADFNEALQLTPGYVGALCNRGVARRELGDLDGATADFEQVLRADPGNLEAARNWAEARREAGDLTAAVAALELALSLAPRAAAAGLHFDRGNIRLQQGDWPAAILDFDQALTIDPQFVEAHVYRGSARHHNCEPLAFVDYLHAFRLDPPLAAREIVELVHLDLLRNPDTVFEVCDKHLARIPDDPVALLRRGLSFLLLGRAQEAASDLGRSEGLSADVRSCRALLERAVAERQNFLKTGAVVPNEGLLRQRKIRFRTGPRPQA